MSFSKSYGPLTISQSNGVASISIDDSVAVGGGSMKGVVDAEGKGSVNVHELVLADAGLGVLASKYPQFSAEIALLQGELDAGLAKI